MRERFKIPLGEYSEIEKDDGEFCEGDEEFVNNLAAVPELQNVSVSDGSLGVCAYHYRFSEIVWGKIDSVVSEAILYSCF